MRAWIWMAWLERWNNNTRQALVTTTTKVLWVYEWPMLIQLRKAKVLRHFHETRPADSTHRWYKKLKQLTKQQVSSQLFALGSLFCYGQWEVPLENKSLFSNFTGHNCGLICQLSVTGGFVLLSPIATCSRPNKLSPLGCSQASRPFVSCLTPSQRVKVFHANDI